MGFSGGPRSETSTPGKSPVVDGGSGSLGGRGKAVGPVRTVQGRSRGTSVVSPKALSPHTSHYRLLLDVLCPDRTPTPRHTRHSAWGVHT